VESVISIAVVAFAMMGILGMVPIGLATFRSAMNHTVESSILQEVAGELQRTDSIHLAATNLYFDEQGFRVSSGDSRFIYTVEIAAPSAVDTGSLIAPQAASLVAIRIHNRFEPSVTNRHSVILPRSRQIP
jgi:uncharacterized protein (TIGR02598 family)